MKHMSMWITCILFAVVTYICMMLYFYLHRPTEVGNIQQKYLPLIIVYFHPNIEFLFQYWLFWWILCIIFIWLYIYIWCIIMETLISSLPTFNWTKNPDMINIKWEFFYCGNVKVFIKYIYNFFVKNRIFLRNYYSSLISVNYVIT